MSKRAALLTLPCLRGREVPAAKRWEGGGIWQDVRRKDMKYDLLIQHGEVLDPAAGLSGKQDVGIAGGKIVEVGPSLPEKEARRTVSARV